MREVRIQNRFESQPPPIRCFSCNFSNLDETDAVGTFGLVWTCYDSSPQANGSCTTCFSSDILTCIPCTFCGRRARSVKDSHKKKREKKGGMMQPSSSVRTHLLLRLLLLLLLVAVLTEGFACPVRWMTGSAEPTTKINGAPQRQCRQRSLGVGCSTGGDRSSNDVPAGADTLLGQVQTQTTIWSDTADVDTVERLRRSLGIVDVTTNPSIVSAIARGKAAAGESNLLLQVCMVILRVTTAVLVSSSDSSERLPVNVHSCRVNPSPFL